MPFQILQSGCRASPCVLILPIRWTASLWRQPQDRIYPLRRCAPETFFLIVPHEHLTAHVALRWRSMPAKRSTRNLPNLCPVMLLSFTYSLLSLRSPAGPRYPVNRGNGAEAHVLPRHFSSVRSCVLVSMIGFSGAVELSRRIAASSPRMDLTVSGS